MSRDSPLESLLHEEQSRPAEVDEEMSNLQNVEAVASRSHEGFPLASKDEVVLNSAM